jgi:hypothetical protein
MFTKTKTALSVAIVLGALGSASAALASDHEDQSGGFVMPGSMDGVNPVYHPDIFGHPATAKAYGFIQSQNGGTAYGSSAKHKLRSTK